MTAHSAGHGSLPATGWQLAPRCYNISYRGAALRALLVALVLVAGLAILLLI